MENGCYVYGESELLSKIPFRRRRRRLLDFVSRLGYVRGVVPSDEDDKKRLEHLIDVSLLMGTCSLEGRQISFGKPGILFILHY